MDISCGERNALERPEWVWLSKKCKLHIGDELFCEGNAVCHQNMTQVPVEDDDNYVEENLIEFENVKVYDCHVPSCHETFINLQAYEFHVKSNHTHVCSECHRNFPTTYVLELHVLETHDTLFHLLATKKDMYECLVESCPEKFKDAQIRKQHLVTTHQYPSNFRFDHVDVKRKKKNRPKLREKQPADSKVGTTESSVTSDLKIQESHAAAKSQSKFVPRSVCFGAGSQKGFPQGKNKSKGQRKHWHQQGVPSETAMDIEQIDLSELVNSLE